MYNNEETISPFKNKHKQNAIQKVSCKIQSLYKGFIKNLFESFFITHLQHFL